MDPARHQCLIYKGSPAKHLESLATAIVGKLNANIRCLYLNSPPMVAGISSYLAARGLNVAESVEKGDLVLSSDRSHVVEGRFTGSRMLEMLEEAVDQARTDGYAGLFATGDMTWELGPERSIGALLAYERGLEDIFRRVPSLSGVCQYHVDTLPPDLVRSAFQTHSSLYINETLSKLNPYYAAVRDGGTGRAEHSEMLLWLARESAGD